MRAQVGRQDDQAREVLDALQEIRHLLIGGAVVGVPRLRAPAEQRVGLVEEQDPLLVLGVIEQARQVLLRLADPFRYHFRQVDAVDGAARGLAQQRGGERLAGAGRAVEQRAVAGF